MTTKTFDFQVSVEAIPYNKETAPKLYGSYIEDYPEYTDASEILHEMIKDAVCSALEHKTSYMSNHKKEDDPEGYKRMMDYYDKKYELYKNIEKSVKPILKR